jgi:hypothetical protein
MVVTLFRFNLTTIKNDDISLFPAHNGYFIQKNKFYVMEYGFFKSSDIFNRKIYERLRY